MGPTAIGKTALSLKMAKYFETDIISADSRQFFKEMTIGTATPSKKELKEVKHHFIHHKSITENYNVGAFEKDALQLLDDLFVDKDVVILVGGSGLYVDAVIEGLDDFPEIDISIRESLNHQLAKNGMESLQKQLKALDVETYNKISIDNPHRVIRALEVCIGTGMPYSSFLNKEKTTRIFQTITIGLSADRDIIYDRINRRVDIMMDDGLLFEVKELLPNQHLNALNTVGYKELFNYLNGNWTLEFAVSEIKKNSRRFAKRQTTWFRKKKDILWFEFDSDIKDILEKVEQTID